MSMLLHAADLANRVGSSAAQYFMDSVSRLMVSMSLANLHGRMNVLYSPDLLTLFLRIHTVVLTYLSVRSQHPVGSYVTDIYQ